ncbi:MAG TPA: hypothetical protein PKX07_12490, partial [Aggregatilineales bacterium]|nr:hypothetical protein [Aggregatilineales bacterium]
DEPSATFTPTDEPTATSTPTDEPTTTSTATAEATAVIVPPVDTPPADGGGETPTGGGLPPEAIVGGVVIAAVLIYLGFYLRGQAALDRYRGGFAVEICPACRTGHLSVETRTSRVLGVPFARHTARCDTCRSLLRETRPRVWRYAVDRSANPALYERYNNRELTEESLVILSRAWANPSTPVTPPDFVNDDTPDDAQPRA